MDKVEKDEKMSTRESDVFREQHQNMDAINSALRKIKYRGDQSSHSICSRRKTWPASRL